MTLLKDCGGEPVLTEIKARFGHEVAVIVESCTDSFEIGPKRDWRERKVAYLEHLQESDTASLLVVAADKLHNLLSIQRDLTHEGAGLWLRFNAGPDDQMWYYDSIIEILKRRLDNPIVSTLEQTLTNVRRQMKQEKNQFSKSGE